MNVLRYYELIAGVAGAFRALRAAFPKSLSDVLALEGLVASAFVHRSFDLAAFEAITQQIQTTVSDFIGEAAAGGSASFADLAAKLRALLGLN